MKYIKIALGPEYVCCIYYLVAQEIMTFLLTLCKIDLCMYLFFNFHSIPITAYESDHEYSALFFDRLRGFKVQLLPYICPWYVIRICVIWQGKSRYYSLLFFFRYYTKCINLDSFQISA